MFHSMIKLHISDHGSRIAESYHEPAVLFLLRGRAEIIFGTYRMELQAEDYVVINSYEIFTLNLQENGLIGCMTMDYSMVSDYLKLAEYDIRCSSQMTDAEVRERLRRRIKRLISFYELQDGEEASRMMSLFFEFLYDLRENCMVKKSAGIRAKKSDDTTVEAIIRRFLEEHYQEKVMLKDLARETYFSEAYLSRYIKQHFGKNFLKLLTDIRVSHARQLLRESETSVIRVAMDSGFADVAALNKAFLSEYGLSPVEYRKEEQEHARLEQAEKEKQEEALGRKIQDFFRKEGADYGTEEPDIQRLFADAGRFRRLKNYWTKMINAGRAQDLLRADVQFQILMLRNEIGFRYMRFWDLWSPEMQIYKGDGKGHYNFSVLDAIIAFLYDHHIYPYIEIGFKPLQLIGDIFSSLIYEERTSPFEDPEEFVDCIEEMLRHYIWLYGSNYVERWYLELWLDTRTEAYTDYYELFEAVYNRIKALLPGIRIGGAGTNREKKSEFEGLIRGWKNRLYQPDFLSLYLYPFDNGFLNPAAYEKTENPLVWRDGDYTVRFLKKVRKLLRENDFRTQELHLSEWNFTASSRDLINDSTFKGAYVVKSLLEMSDQVDAASYWPGSDLVAGYYDARHLMNGSAGILTRNAIRKPAFYGFQFFSQLDDYVIGQDANCIVTTNRRGSFRIVCHNYQQPNETYYEQFPDEKAERKATVTDFEAADLSQGEKEERIVILPGGKRVKENAFSYFSYEEREFRIVIRNVENGSYYIKKRLMDRQHGSVQDEWKRMGFSDALNVKDIEYLRGICVPQILMDTVTVHDGNLTIDYRLETNAIMSIHIFRTEEG